MNELAVGVSGKPGANQSFEDSIANLLYPILATSIIAAVPIYIELYSSLKLGVNYGDSRTAVERNKLWVKNMECTQAPFDWLTTSFKRRVDATICESGDVLLRYLFPTNEGKYV